MSSWLASISSTTACSSRSAVSSARSAASSRAAAERAEDKAERELQAVVDEMLASQLLMGQVARRAYQTAGMGQIAVALEAENPEDFTTRVVLLQNVLQTENGVLGRLAESRADIDAGRALLAAKRVIVADLREAAAAALDKTRVIEERAEAARARVSRLIGERRNALTVARQAAAEDRRRYEAMQAESRRLQGVLAARAAAARAAAATTASSNVPAGPGLSSSTGLSYPVSGPVTSSYGMRVHPITGVYKLHDGTDFGAPCGTAIRAAAAGTVVQTGYAGGYGNQTVIDHGAVRGVGLATSYNHQTSYSVSPGQYVSRGQVIGSIGSTGFSTGCHLHFMVYVNGGPVDPMSWL